MPQFLSRQKELLCKQSRKLRGCKSYLRLHSKDDQFILAAKKLWVRLALCTMFIVFFCWEYAAANLRIDGLSEENPRPLSLWAVRILVDYRCLISSRGVSITSLPTIFIFRFISYNRKKFLKDTRSNSKNGYNWFDSNLAH